VLLFGDKIDLINKRVIQKDEGEAKARELGLPFFEGSAKTSENVRNAFEKITDLIGQMRPASGANVLQGENRRRNAPAS
jgi:GTPase SAR1 family protein